MALRKFEEKFFGKSEKLLLEVFVRYLFPNGKYLPIFEEMLESRKVVVSIVIMWGVNRGSF